MMGSSFRSLKVVDERIKSLNLAFGQNERPLWKAIENITVEAQIKWIDRISPYEAIASEWALAGAYEKSLAIKVPMRAEYLRALLLELQRILWGCEYLKSIFKTSQDEIRVEQALRLREYIFQGQEIFTGSRVLPQALEIGGLSRDFSIGDVKKFKDILRNIEYEMRLFFKNVQNEVPLSKFLRGVMPISKESMKKIKWGGPVAQASGVINDIRLSSSELVYSKLPVTAYKAENSNGDAFERMLSVLFQVRQSVNLSYQILNDLPDGEVKASKIPTIDKAKVASEFSVEGASGLVTAILDSGRVRVTTTSMRVKDKVESLFEGLPEEQIDIALASLGFSFAEADLV